MDKKQKRKVFNTIGGNSKGENAIKCNSPWNPGRCQPSKKFNNKKW